MNGLGSNINGLRIGMNSLEVTWIVLEITWMILEVDGCTRTIMAPNKNGINYTKSDNNVPWNDLDRNRSDTDDTGSYMEGTRSDYKYDY